MSEQERNKRESAGRALIFDGKNAAAYFDPLGEAKAPPFCDVVQMNTKEGA